MYAKISLDTSDYEDGLSDASTTTENFASKLSSGVTAAAEVAATAIAAVSTAVVALGTQIVEYGSNYETALAQVGTIMDTSEMSVEDMSSAILSASSELGVAASDISESVYNAISATGDTAGAVDLVSDATKLATAGFTDSSSALSVLTTAINAYGMSTEDAAEISDSLIMVQNLGVTTVAELASGMGKAIATASAYNVDLGNLESSYVSLTKAGISTEESTTYLSSMLSELGDTGSDVAAVIEEQTGQSFSELMASGYSLGDVLGIVYEACNEDSTAMMNLWSSTEAGKASNAIISQGLEEFNENLEAITNSAGATEEAYETMCDTLEHKTETLKTAGQNLMIAMYDGMSDQLADVVDFANEAVTELSTAFEEGGISGMLEAASGIMSSAIEMLLSYVPDIAEVAIEIISALVQGIAENVPQMAEAAIEIIETLVEALAELIPQLAESGMEILEWLANGLSEGIPTLVAALPEVISSILEYITENLPSFLDSGVEIVTSILDGILDGITELVAGLPEIITAIVDFISENLPEIMEAGGEIIGELIVGILAAIPDLVASLPELIAAFVEGIASLMESVVEAGASLIQGLIEGILSGVSDLIESAKEVGQNFLSSIKDFFGIASPSALMEEQGGYLVDGLIAGMEDMPDEMDSIFSDAVSAAETFGSDLGSEASSAAENLYETFTSSVDNLVTNLSTNFSTALQTVSTWGTNVVSQVKTAGSNVVSNMASSLSSLGSKISSSLSSALSSVSSWGSEMVTSFTDIGANVINGMISGISSMVSSLYNSIYNSLSGLVSKAKSALGISSPSTVFAEIGEYSAEGLEEGWSETIGDVSDTIAADLEAIPTDAGSGLVSAMEEMLEALPTDIASGLTDALTEGIDFLPSDVGSGLVDVLVEGLDSLPTDVGSGLTTALLESIDEIPTDAGSGLVDIIVEETEDLPDELSDIYAEVLAEVEEWEEDMTGEFTSLGENVISGLIAGMESMIPTMYQAIEDGLSGLVDQAKDTLGIASPSKVFESIGEDMAAGLSSGWDNGVEDFQRGISDDLQFGATTPEASAAGQLRQITVTQNIYSQAKTAADLLREARWQQERAVLSGV